jgi:hypothetical protein
MDIHVVSLDRATTVLVPKLTIRGILAVGYQAERGSVAPPIF